MARAATAPVREMGYATVQGSSWWMPSDEEMTPELQWPRSIAVYDRMRRQDAQVISVLRAVTLPVRRTPWRIDPAGARPEVTQMVAEDLGLPVLGEQLPPLPRTRDRFSWTDHLRLALLSLTYGFSPFEQVYRIDDAGFARLRKLAWRSPRTLSAVNVAADGGLLSLEQFASSGTFNTVKLPVSRLVVYVNEREGGNWLGQSLLRAAYKNWLIKDRLLRVQAQTIERNGMGIPIYEGQPDATKDDLDEGKRIAQSVRAGDLSAAAIPNGAKLVFQGVDGTLPDADPAIRYHDEQIARAVLAHFLNLGTQTGSWALGSTFADFFTLSLQAVAQAVADVATQHIVEDIVDVNFGESEPAPRVVFDEIGSRQALTAQAVKLLLDAGALSADPGLEAAVRQQFGLPPSNSRPSEA